MAVDDEFTAPTAGPLLERLTRIDARLVWPHEAHDFTPWLAANAEGQARNVGENPPRRTGAASKGSSQGVDPDPERALASPTARSVRECTVGTPRLRARPLFDSDRPRRTLRPLPAGPERSGGAE